MKLLDFGTGTLLDPDAGQTVTRMRMLTPRYASPERVRGEPAGIPSDVYSLGVILYETLTGAWPFGDPHSAVNELHRALGDTAPSDPASVITVEAADHRALPVGALKRRLAGDLSASAFKAMEPEPARRYATVGELAGDIESYLAAQSVNEFLSGILSTFAMQEFDAGKFTVAEMLQNAEARLESGPKLDPLVEAIVRRSLAESYIGLSRTQDARRQLDRALPIFFKSGDSPELAAALFERGSVELQTGDYPAAVQDLDRTLELLRRLGKSARPIAVFEAKLRLADTLSAGRLNRDSARTRQLIRDAIELGERDPSIPRTRLAAALAAFGGVLATGWPPAGG